MDALDREPHLCRELLAPGTEGPREVRVSMGALVEKGAQRGFSFREEEIHEVLAARVTPPPGELGGDALDAVVGGANESPIAASRFGISVDGVQFASFAFKG